MGESKWYLIVVKKEEMWLVGPFDEQLEAREWGRLSYPHDIRWQSIFLNDDQVMNRLRLRDPVFG